MKIKYNFNNIDQNKIPKIKEELSRRLGYLGQETDAILKDYYEKNKTQTEKTLFGRKHQVTYSYEEFYDYNMNMEGYVSFNFYSQEESKKRYAINSLIRILECELQPESIILSVQEFEVLSRAVKWANEN